MLAYLQQRRTMVIFTNNRHFLGIKKCWIELKKKILYSLLHNLLKRYLMDSQIAWKMHACTRFKKKIYSKNGKKKMFFILILLRGGNILILHMCIPKRKTCTFPLFIRNCFFFPFNFNVHMLRYMHLGKKLSEYELWLNAEISSNFIYEAYMRSKSL